MLRGCRRVQGWGRRCRTARCCLQPAWLLRHGCRIFCYDNLIAACLMSLLHHYRNSEDEVENGKDERDLSNDPIPVHLWDVICRVYFERSRYQYYPVKCTAIKNNENRRKV